MATGNSRLWKLAGLTLVVQVALLFMVERAVPGADFLRFQISVSPDLSAAMMDVWGWPTRVLLAQHYWLDFIYPIIYGFFLRECLLRLRMPFAWLPFLASAGDLLENIIQLSLLTGRVSAFHWLFYVGAAAAIFKWGVIVATFALIARGLWLHPPAIMRATKQP